MKVNISSYSGLVSGGDWAASLMAAWAAIKQKGGEIVIDADIELKSPATLQTAPFAPVPLIISSDRGYRLKMNGNSGTAGIILGNVNLFSMEKVTVVGTGLDTSQVNCSSFLFASYVNKLLVKDCIFAGMGVQKAVIHNSGVNEMRVENSRLCGGFTAGANSAMIYSESSNRVIVSFCDFYDYENLGGPGGNAYYSKTPFGVSSWIRVDTAPGAIANGANNPNVMISDCRFDEGAQTSVYIDGHVHAQLERNASNLFSASGGNGYTLKNLKEAYIKQCNFGYTANDQPAVIRNNVDFLRMVGCTKDHGVNRIDVDTATNLKILDGSFAVNVI